MLLYTHGRRSGAGFQAFFPSDFWKRLKLKKEDMCQILIPEDLEHCLWRHSCLGIETRNTDDLCKYCHMYV
jgi:hypothetical protein